MIAAPLLFLLSIVPNHPSSPSTPVRLYHLFISFFCV
jgi:hypothetical protein